MSRSHMTNQNLNFHRTHEEEQGINFASFFFRLTTRIVQILIGNVTARRVSTAILPSVWSIYKSP